MHSAVHSAGEGIFLPSSHCGPSDHLHLSRVVKESLEITWTWFQIPALFNSVVDLDKLLNLSKLQFSNLKISRCWHSLYYVYFCAAKRAPRGLS